MVVVRLRWKVAVLVVLMLTKGAEATAGTVRVVVSPVKTMAVLVLFAKGAEDAV
jgi:hypothetical protein